AQGSGGPGAAPALAAAPAAAQLTPLASEPVRAMNPGAAPAPDAGEAVIVDAKPATLSTVNAKPPSAPPGLARAALPPSVARPAAPVPAPASPPESPENDPFARLKRK
ncbi:MAG: 2-oxoglutarate dehydrogenase, E2 component, dihydrolipoamide succinyltransferase, partial [Polyangiaceae bacterium]